MQTFAAEHDTFNTGFGLGLGIGLGLPSSFSNGQRRSPRCSSISSQDSPLLHASNMLFPFSTTSRHASEATLKLDGLASYWSPMTEDGEGFEQEDNAEEEEDYEEDLAESTSSSSILDAQLDQSKRTLQLAPHTALHLLSPKLDSLARAAARETVSGEEAISTAVEWAWLVPMLDTSLPASQEQKMAPATDSTRGSPAHAPAMMHMPSLESIASSITLADSEGYVPSIAASSYQSDMARSHSLLSSFSVASFSTAASSVASTSKSILDRKRPLPSRAVSSNNDRAQVIKLRSRRTYQRPIQGDVGSESSLIRRDTKMSIVSQKASIHCASPTADELDCMVFEPMQPLPSPTMYSSENQESPCTCGSQSDIGVTSPSEEARNALFEIWTAAEEMERQRKLKKRQPIKQTRPVPSDSNTQRVHKWVSKVRKSASLGNLRARASGDDALNVVEDPIAWAEGNNSKSTVVESGREELMEPRSAREEKVKGIEQVLDQSCVGNTMRIVQSAPKVRQEVIAGHIWDFLG